MLGLKTGILTLKDKANGKPFNVLYAAENYTLHIFTEEAGTIKTYNGLFYDRKGKTESLIKMGFSKREFDEALHVVVAKMAHVIHEDYVIEEHKKKIEDDASCLILAKIIRKKHATVTGNDKPKID